MERSAEQVISPNNSVRLLAHKAEGRVWGKVSNGDGGSSWDNHNNNNNKCFGGLGSCARFSSSSSVSLHCSPSSLCSPRRRLTSCSAQVQGEFRCNQSTFISNGNFLAGFVNLSLSAKCWFLCPRSLLNWSIVSSKDSSWLPLFLSFCCWVCLLGPPCNVIFSKWQIKTCNYFRIWSQSWKQCCERLKSFEVVVACKCFCCALKDSWIGQWWWVEIVYGCLCWWAVLLSLFIGLHHVMQSFVHGGRNLQH